MKKILIYTLIAFFFLPAVGVIHQPHTSDDILSSSNLIVSAPIAHAEGGFFFDFSIRDITDGIASSIGASIAPAIDAIITTLSNLILSFFGLILWLAAIILNISIHTTIINMSSVINAANMPALYASWSLVRDISNLLFIFVLLYAAIATILNLGINTGRTIVKVVIAALLINFSLFFTQIIIDASNILALRFFELIGASYTRTGTFDINSLDSGLSAAFMDNLKLNTIYNVQTGDVLTDVIGNTSAMFGRIILGSILIVTTAVIFFVAAIMLIVRFVILIFLLILSPIAFVSTILPQLSGIGKKWWKALFDQAIFAPALMLMFYITIQMSESLNTVITTGAGIAADQNAGVLGAVAKSQAANASVLLSTLLVFAFMIGSLVIAKMAGGSGGDWATKVGGKAVFGGLAFAGRQTGGRLGRRIADSRTLKDARNDGNFVTRNAARLALKTGDFGAKSNFDARSATEGAVSGLSSALGGGKISLGKTSKGGFDDQLKRKAKKIEEDAKSLEPSDLDISRSEQNLKTQKEQLEKREKELASAKASGYSPTMIATKQRLVDTQERQVAGAIDRLDKLKGVDKKEAERRAKEKITGPTVKKYRAMHPGERSDAYKADMEADYARQTGGKFTSYDDIEKDHYQKAYAVDTRDEAVEKEAESIQKANPGIGNVRKEQAAKRQERVATTRVGKFGQALHKVFTAQTRTDLERNAAAYRKAKKGEEKIEDIIKSTITSSLSSSGGGSGSSSSTKP